MQRKSPEERTVSRVAERLMGFYSLDMKEWVEEFGLVQHPRLNSDKEGEHHSWMLDPKDPDDLTIVKTYMGTAHLWTCQFIGDSCSVITPGFSAEPSRPCPETGHCIQWHCLTEKSHDHRDIIVYDDGPLTI